MVFVASCCLAAVPGIATVVIAPPWVKLVVAFPRVVVNLSLLPEFSDLSWSGGIGEGGRHGGLSGKLLGVEGTGGKFGNLDGEYVVFPGGFLYSSPPSCNRCPHLGHSAFCVVCCIGFIVA